MCTRLHVKIYTRMTSEKGTKKEPKKNPGSTVSASFSSPVISDSGCSVMGYHSGSLPFMDASTFSSVWSMACTQIPPVLQTANTPMAFNPSINPSLPSPIAEFKIAVLAAEALRLLSLIDRVENFPAILTHGLPAVRSEERRVGKEGGSG